MLNVLRGEMSLVGPRPEMPFIVERYNELQKTRLRVKPGITGLWQLSADRRLAIHENGACAALSFSTANLGACQAKPFAQQGREARRRTRVDQEQAAPAALQVLIDRDDLGLGEVASRVEATFVPPI